MRRIDVIVIGLAVFLGGGGLFVALRVLGLNDLSAGVWSQALLVLGLIGYLSTYLVRALTQKMTYNQQLKDYEEAVLAQRLAELSPEELAKLQAEVEAERQQTGSPDAQPDQPD